MLRFRIPIVLICLLVPALSPASGPDAELQSRLSPAMHRQLEEDAGPYRVWVFFADKGLPHRAARAQAIADVAATYHPRAVERRKLRSKSAVEGGPLFDLRDVPVYEPYVHQVAATGARVRRRSRWVNAVSAVATRSQIDEIAALAAVTKVQPVARSKRPESEELSEARPDAVPEGPAETAALDYGRSTAQLTQINLIALHEAGYTGEGVIVGVLDTGFRRDHAAFNQSGSEIEVVAEYDFVDDDPDTSNQTGDPSTQHDHGTKILGTLGSYHPGELVGGAFGASFALAKTEDTTGEYQAEEDNYVAGLEFLEANGADMTTSSLGYIDWYTQADLDGETAVTTIAINTAGDLGVHTVTAAGNEYHDSNPATSSIIAPADAFLVITAGAVTSSGSIASFSSDGPSADGRVKPELLALGSGTATISSSTTTGFTTADGTSLSTPLIAGAVACLIQANPDWTVEVMREELFRNADHDPGGFGFDPLYVRGYGIVDAMATHANAYTPAGYVQIQEPVYSCDDTLVITLRDDNVPGEPSTIAVELSSPTESGPEIVTLTQIDPGLGRYQGTFATTSGPPVNGDGALSVSHGEVVTVYYVDADDGDGNANVTAQDSTEVDCLSPAIANVQSSEVSGNSALITWDTDEPADSLVIHGLTPPGTVSDGDPDLVTLHALRLQNLEECSVHYYSVASADAVGNSAGDDNAGASYTFETGRNVNPTYLASDTPIPIADNATQLSVIDVTDTKTVLDVKVGLEITHTYTGDLDITLISPLGTRVLLSADNGSGGDNFTGTWFDDAAATSIGSGTAPFTGSFQPDQPLGALVGQNSLGPWTLEVIDDAGADTGTLESWTLELSFAPQACGASATYGSHGHEADSCSAGAGDDNGFWDAGELIRFSLIVQNDGTDPLTGVTVQVNPLTEGVAMLDGMADVGSIAQDSSASSLPPHITAWLPVGMTCAQEVTFEVVIDSNEGTWTKTFAQVAGNVIPGGGVAFAEDFEVAGIPAGWTIVDGLADGFTWFTDSSGDPAGCANSDPAPPLAGNWAAVDSDCAGSGVAMDEELIGPVIDMTGSITAALEFDHYLNWLGPETADVDVRSSLTGGAWVNVARWTADTANPDHAILDITAQAADVNDLQIRWHYYDAEFEWFWYVDNVVVRYTSTGDCLMPECLAGPTGPPPIPDGSLGGVPMTADRLEVDGSRILLTWDERCTPVHTNLLYGSLGQVSSLALDGAGCGIAGPHVWDPAPAGDLWFLLVSDDGAGTESSWGLGWAGERNGLSASGMCGTTSKDATGTCP